MYAYNLMYLYLFIYLSIYVYLLQAQQLGILPSGKMADLRTKLEAKPRQLLVMNVDDRDMLVKYFEVRG